VTLFKASLLGVTAALATLASASGASALVYDWRFTDPTDGVFGAGAFSEVAGYVTAISGSITTSNGTDNSISLLADPTPGQAYITPDGHWEVDNLYPVDVDGFYATGALNSVYNLWSNLPAGATVGTSGSGSLGISDNSGNCLYTCNGVNGTLSITQVPEPAAWALMLLGIGFAGAALRDDVKRDRPVD
jgi:hypothetical protein